MFPLSVLLAFSGISASAGPALGPADVVSFDGPTTPDLDLAIADLLQTLPTMTGRPWRREAKSPRGVRLILRDSQEPAFKGRSLEAFRLRAQGDDVELSAVDPKGLVLAAYELLDRLGARWAS